MSEPKSEPRPRILGTGYCVPKTIRTNDDPIFAWLQANNPPGKNLFAGYEQRRVLAADEDLMTIMVPAAASALAGSVTVSTMVTVAPATVVLMSR